VIYHIEARGDLLIGNATRFASKPYPAGFWRKLDDFAAMHTRENPERIGVLICQIPCEGWL
jgi:hypothetical protein